MSLDVRKWVRWSFHGMASEFSSVMLFLHFVEIVWMQLFLGGIIGILVYVICCYKFKIIDEEMLVMLKIKK